MVEKVLQKNTQVQVSVMATPSKKHSNYLSVRLKDLKKIPRYTLINIETIRDKISTKKMQKNRSDTEVVLPSDKIRHRGGVSEPN